MSEPPPANFNRKYQNAYLVYDLDSQDKQINLRVRLLVKEGENEIQTPTPPLYLARLSTDKPLEIPKRKGLEPRQFETCFQSPADPTAAVTRTVFCPYRGGLPQVGGLAQELITYPGVLAVEYRGETQTQNYQEFS